MDKKMLKELLLSARTAGCDLFLSTDSASDICRAEELLGEENENTVLFTPGGCCPGAGVRRLAFRGGIAFFRSGMKGKHIIADIRLLADEEFRGFLDFHGIRNVILAFAECAFRTQYGFSSAYSWIAEWRAGAPSPLHITSFFSDGSIDMKALLPLVGSPDAVAADIAGMPEVHTLRCPDKLSCYSAAAELCERANVKTTAVLFTTRREADEFRRFLYRRNSPPFSVSGKNTETENARTLAAFFALGGVLAATKSVLPYSLFYRADRVVYCGLPYSSAHLSRCALFSRDRSVHCIFCDEDERTDRRVLLSGKDYDHSGDFETLSSEKNDLITQLKDYLLRFE